MKTTCPKCGERHDVADKDIIEHVSRSQNLRRKLAAMMGGRGGKQALKSMTPQARKDRAVAAASKRWEKDSDKTK